MTKTITAVAIMQLQEQGLVDLDAPTGRYLRAFRLIPARPGFGPATLRHLLTHTAGVRAVRKPSDLLRPELGWGVPAGQPVPALAEYYRDGLRIDTEPGTKWAYSNHGFAALGQIAEDVTGIPLGRYLREHVFGPLGMEHSDLLRSERVRPGLATGYQLGSRRLKAVADREAVPAGAPAVYSTASDMARYAAALLGGGAGEHGQVLQPETLATMFWPHYLRFSTTLAEATTLGSHRPTRMGKPACSRSPRRSHNGTIGAPPATCSARTSRVESAICHFVTNQV